MNANGSDQEKNRVTIRQLPTGASGSHFIAEGLRRGELAIVAVGGSIEALNPPDGHEVSSEFPLRTPPHPLPAAADPAPMTPRASTERKVSGLRILIVDDNLDLVMLLAIGLRRVGAIVQTAATGPDGLRMALEWRPDAVLLDIGLPGMDGYEVARSLRSDTGSKGTRLIAVTGYGRDADIALAREAGFDDYMVKPYAFHELEMLLARCGNMAAPERSAS